MNDITIQLFMLLAVVILLFGLVYIPAYRANEAFKVGLGVVIASFSTCMFPHHISNMIAHGEISTSIVIFPAFIYIAGLLVRKDDNE